MIASLFSAAFAREWGRNPQKSGKLHAAQGPSNRPQKHFKAKLMKNRRSYVLKGAESWQLFPFTEPYSATAYTYDCRGTESGHAG